VGVEERVHQLLGVLSNQVGGKAMKGTLRIVCLVIILGWITMGLFTVPPVHAKGTLIGYTAASGSVEAIYVEAFKKKYPDIEFKTINLSSGPVTSRLIAEKSNPQADVVFGLMESYLKALKEAGAIEPYRRKEIDKIGKEFKDPDDFYVTEDLALMAWGGNTQLLKEKKLPIPKTWEELAKPIYKGMINVASPAQSGTGLTIFTNLYDMYGGWDYIDKLSKNIFQYNSSGGVAGRQAARGECAIGMTYDFALLLLKNEGFPLEVVYPPKTPYAAEGSALVAGAKNQEEAKLFLDFLSSKEAMQAVGKEVTVVTRTDVKLPEAWKPQVSKIDLYKIKKTYDVQKFADEWSKRYTK
jgi:iron(III) transport system substrate-binding protein